MATNGLQKGKILIIDDEERNIRVLERVLKGNGFDHIKSLTDPRTASAVYEDFRPDVVVLDLKMPHLDGFQVIDQLKKVETTSYLPILVLTAQKDPATRLRALDSGARDFLSKPLEITEAITRIRNMLEVRLLHNQVIDQKNTLEEKVQERTNELESTRMEVIHRLGRAAEYRDNETGMHVIRMSHLSALLGREVGMSERENILLLNASPMHDVGKIGIPDSILLKPASLDEEEWRIMKLHPVIGAEILSGSSSELMQMAETISLTHHEWWDGTGYPKGLKGEDIPLVGRIVALCDVFDALTSKRPYKEAYSVEKSMEILEMKSDGQFESQLVKSFKRVLPEVCKILEKFGDEEEEMPNILKVQSPKVQSQLSG